MLETTPPVLSQARPLTRDDLVRMEGSDAARRGALAHDNPYRGASADGIAWREGFDRATAL